jgi:UDP-glucose:(heptosyl)LPS alpha-1,3-glucosyltransferase
MERVAHGFAQWMVREGHCVDVWCDEFVGGVDGIRHRRLGSTGRGVVWKAMSLASAVSRVPVDDYRGFLHFERGGRGGVYRAGAGCHGAFRQQVGGGLLGPWMQRLDERSCADAGLVVVNSQMVFDELRDLYAIDPAKLRLVRNGVDLEHFKPGQRSQRPEIVFVGHDARRKGLDTAILAIANLPDVALVVVGGVTARAKAWARAAGVADRVHFVGEVSDTAPLIARAHAMVLPTRYDPSANVVLEAMACGVPVVTTSRNGASEILPKPWLVLDDVRDADRLAEVLGCAMTDKTLSTACRNAAQAHGLDGSFGALFRVMTELRA